MWTAVFWKVLDTRSSDRARVGSCKIKVPPTEYPILAKLSTLFVCGKCSKYYSNLPRFSPILRCRMCSWMISLDYFCKILRAILERSWLFAIFRKRKTSFSKMAEQTESHCYLIRSVLNSPWLKFWEVELSRQARVTGNSGVRGLRAAQDGRKGRLEGWTARAVVCRDETRLQRLQARAGSALQALLQKNWALQWAITRERMIWMYIV